MIRSRKTYTSCSDLPLANFIKILVNENYSQLYSESAKFIHKQVDLQSIWASIFNEYNELSKNKQAIHVFGLYKAITILNNKLYIISSSLRILEKTKTIEGYEELGQILRSHLQIPYQYKENFAKELELSISAAKRLVIERDQHLKDYEEINKDDGKKVTEQDYENLLTELGKFMGFKIDKYQTMVSEFISYLNRLNLETDAKQ